MWLHTLYDIEYILDTASSSIYMTPAQLSNQINLFSTFYNKYGHIVASFRSMVTVLYLLWPVYVCEFGSVQTALQTWKYWGVGWIDGWMCGWINGCLDG